MKRGAGDVVAIAGAGPVGLLLALRLVAEGVRPLVLEPRRDARAGSRSIGIHPPSIELLERLGLASRFFARGVLVVRGRAFGACGQLGVVDFASSCPGAHRYVMTIAQEDTEEILRDALEERAPGCVEEGAMLVGAAPDGAGVRARIRRETGREEERSVAALVGCDGKRSATRAAIGAAYDGGAYDGAYAMGDFPETTRFGDDAAIFLTPDGLVESFPLPGPKRRWVVRRDERLEGTEAEAAEIVETVARRTGHRLRASDVERPSGFRAERWLASTFSRGAIALAGDAAHVVSPIGGQGMNLGWLGASTLAAELGRALRGGEDPADALAADARRRRAAARAAIRRAELNMWLGRPTSAAGSRDRLVSTLLARPCGALLARVFTMRHLGV
jgi:2-polyprenyl-6-methoxyphenol hydroxylase-like FAD-dependent oxidoreductase